MPSIPLRLISSEEKVNIIKNSFCGNCKLNRRTNIDQILTPGEELDANIWRTQDIFGLSVNVDLCDDIKPKIESFRDDVNIVPVNFVDNEFISDLQLEDYDFKEILVKKLDSLIIFLITNELKSIEGTYPFKGGTPDEEIYNFKIQIEHKPMILNAFHFQIEIFTNQTGEWAKIDRKSAKKNYIRGLASKIRNRLLSEKKVYSLVIDN